MRNRFVRNASIPLALVGLCITACSDSTAPQLVEAPPLPDVLSLQPDLAFFETARPGAGTNYEAALAAVNVARAATIVSLPVPVQLYGPADETEPEEESNGWAWTYGVTDGTQIYNADLLGRARGVDDVIWEMRVTSATHVPALTDFLWMTGRADLIRANNEWFSFTGEWHTFDPSTPAQRTPLLDITWSIEGNDSRRIIYKNVKPGSPDQNDFLEFQNATVLSRIIHFDASATREITVHWDRTTNEGWIFSSAYNGGNKACWNASFANITCPPV